MAALTDQNSSVIDDDNPEWTEADFARSSGPDSLSDAELAAFPRTRARLGRPTKESRKAQITLRLDPDVLAHFRATGPGWQSRINKTLRSALSMPTVASSAIRSVDYDAKSRTLFVVFGDGDRYAYFEVPLELFTAFLGAESKGRFFAEHVRDRFDYHLIR